MQQLSQRDPKWSQIPLGTSSKTIGTHGCTITSLAMILGTTPVVVNAKLLQVGGYKDGNLLIWAKLQEAFPGVTVRREWAYNNDDVLANLPVIVQVDGSPIGAPMHFVVYIGNQQLIDPWDGQVKPTSTYAAQSYAVVKNTLVVEPTGNYYKGLDLSNVESMKIAVDTWEKMKNGELVDKNAVANSEVLQNQIKATTECQTQLQTALEQNKLDQEVIATLQEQIKDVKSKYEDEKRTVIDLKTEIAAIHKEDADYGQAALDAEHLANDRKEIIGIIADNLGVKYDPKNDREAIEMILHTISELRKVNVPEEESQLVKIAKRIDALGANKYFVKKGIPTFDPKKPGIDFAEKAKVWLEDLADEFFKLDELKKKLPSVQAPVLESMEKTIENKKSLKEKILGIFYQ